MMEKLLFEILWTGQALLSVSLVTGILFIDDIFAQHLVHKTLLSLAAWMIYAIMLWGRYYQGWRGIAAIRWTLGGFVFLMLAYFGSKLVLPNDQIKYLEIETGRLSKSRRKAAAITALEEATPYKAEDLAFDVVAQGRITHVAAVARETLAEAEAFAVEHRFNPLCFVAIPPADGFPTEPVFGLTAASEKMLDGAALEADETMIRVTGSGPLQSAPDPEPAADPTLDEPQEPPAEPASASKPDNSSTVEPETSPEPEPAEDAPDEEVPISAFSSIRARRDDTGPASSDTSPRPVGRAERSVAGTNAPGLPAATQQNTPHAEVPLHFDPTEVIAGLNLPMLIKLASVRGREPMEVCVAHAQDAGRKYISVASWVLSGEK